MGAVRDVRHHRERVWAGASRNLIELRFSAGSQHQGRARRSEMFGGTLLAANQGTSIPSFWRFDTFVEAKVDKNWTAKLFVANITNKLYYDALYQIATPFVFVAPGRSVSMVISARF